MYVDGWLEVRAAACIRVLEYVMWLAYTLMRWPHKRLSKGHVQVNLSRTHLKYSLYAHSSAADFSESISGETRQNQPLTGRGQEQIATRVVAIDRL